MQRTKQEYQDYILREVFCEVCGKKFDNVNDAIDAGTDLFIHTKCSKNWLQTQAASYLAKLSIKKRFFNKTKSEKTEIMKKLAYKRWTKK